MNTDTIVSVGTGVVLTIIGGYFGFVKWVNDKFIKVDEKIAETKTELKEEISTTNIEVTRLKSTDEVFWKVLGPHLADIIHSPHAPRRDFLTEKWKNTPNTMTEEELSELSHLLELAVIEEKGDKKLVALFFEARIKSVLASMRSSKECVKV